ncbi:hypothetical protein Astex_0322 [Asticcacaulis excentricus CB 48]|uniref:Methyltransferase n=2 Tax=Asticcacaulis excentricus TaxID=78587 RepID=E8RPP3_ASTEC|nr:hypothetical protein Astex_0322 [Asticcacaulis excentricus CB 48]
MEGVGRHADARSQRDFFVSEEDEALWLKLEYFPTPPWAVRAMAEQMPSVFQDPKLQRVFEPAAGRGHIYEPLRQIGLERGFEVRGQDIYAHDPAKGFAVGDFLFPGVTYPGVDVVVTNPPFKLAADFVQRGLEIAADVILLCRLSFLNTAARHDLHFNNSVGNLTTLLPCIERVPMVLGRYDPQASTATEYAWFHYRRGYTGAPVVKPIPPGSRTRHQRPEDVRI